MLICIDGPRSSGKTTFTHLLVDQINGYKIADAERLKEERVETAGITERMLAIVEQSTQTGKVVVCDRFHLTELVMSLLYQRRDQDELIIDTVLVDKALASAGGLSYVLLPTLETLEERTAMRADGRDHDIVPRIAIPMWKWAARKVSAITTVLPNETLVETEMHIDNIIQEVRKRQ